MKSNLWGKDFDFFLSYWTLAKNSREVPYEVNPTFDSVVDQIIWPHNDLNF